MNSGSTRANNYSLQRCSIRLQGYDYLQARASFAAICVQNREYLFENVVKKLDEFHVMQNHIPSPRCIVW